MLSTLPAKVVELLRQPGRKPEIKAVAPMYHDPCVGSDTSKDEEKGSSGFEGQVKHGKLDRWLDYVVAFSGSSLAFFGILVAVLVWCFLGIKFGTDENWQVVISDVQSLLCYIYDSFLVRHELNSYSDNMIAIAQLQSRSHSHLRMLRTLKAQQATCAQEPNVTPKGAVIVEEETAEEVIATKPLLGRIIDGAATVLGHVLTLMLFWVAVVIWLAFGPTCDWSDEWQLYMNSATSCLMIVLFILLANIGQRHAVHTKQSLSQLFKADATLELQLRALTHDIEPNPEVTLPAPKVGKAQRAIFYYADFVGTLMGIGILTAVICIWTALGPVLQYSSSWWLLIGTYAGLIGMFDGFVLRNMQGRLRSYTEHELIALHEQDRLMLETAGCAALSPTDSIMDGENATEKTKRISQALTARISHFIDRMTSHEAAVGLSLLTLIGLVAGSTAMHWSLTGQLISNVPPSIIESWLMLTLITGHNLIEEGQREELKTLYARRTGLLAKLRSEAPLAIGVEMKVEG